MNNRKGWGEKEWAIILPIKLEIRKELKEEWFKKRRNKYVKSNC